MIIILREKEPRTHKMHKCYASIYDTQYRRPIYYYFIYKISIGTPVVVAFSYSLVAKVVGVFVESRKTTFWSDYPYRPK